MELPRLTELPDDEYSSRIFRVREAMEFAGVDVGLAYGNEFVPGDVQYLTGYDPQIEAAAVLISRDAVAVLGGPEGAAMFADQRARGQWFNFELFEVPFQDYGDLKFFSVSDVLDAMGKTGETEVTLLSDSKYTPIAIVDLFKAHGVAIRNAPGILAECRYQKSRYELDLFAESSRIATLAVESMIGSLRPGMTELEVASIGDAVMKRLGAYSYGWDTMVLSGPRINSVIGRASNKTISEGEMAIVGACPRLGGYCSTVGRTLVVGGSPTKEQAAFLGTGARALELAAERLVEGGAASDIDKAPRELLTRNGLGKYHAYGVGHGIGFSECLELRTATSSSNYTLGRGFAMMLDVGIFGNPEGLNGRFEDPYVIDHEGQTRRLTTLEILVSGQ